MQFNKESNSFIIIFVLIMVLVVALSLSLISSGLRPLKEKNQIVDKKTKILKSVIIVEEDKESELFTSEFVLNEYEENIEEIAVDHQGNVLEDVNVFEVNFAKEVKKPEAERKYPVYIYEDEEQTYHIIPLVGLGLWDEISGYLAIKSDYRTIRGAAFDHKAETPGLGARITEYWFRKQFQEKKLYDKDGDYLFNFLKGENNPEVKTNPHVVDGLSGATLTINGAETMIEKCVGYYEPYFDKQEEKTASL